MFDSGSHQKNYITEQFSLQCRSRNRCCKRQRHLRSPPLRPALRPLPSRCPLPPTLPQSSRKCTLPSPNPQHRFLQTLRLAWPQTPFLSPRRNPRATRARCRPRRRRCRGGWRCLHCPIRRRWRRWRRWRARCRREPRHMSTSRCRESIRRQCRQRRSQHPGQIVHNRHHREATGDRRRHMGITVEHLRFRRLVSFYLKSSFGSGVFAVLSWHQVKVIIALYFELVFY